MLFFIKDQAIVWFARRKNTYFPIYFYNRIFYLGACRSTFFFFYVRKLRLQLIKSYGDLDSTKLVQVEGICRRQNKGDSESETRPWKSRNIMEKGEKGSDVDF